jgi:hypothetical protein
MPLIEIVINYQQFYEDVYLTIYVILITYLVLYLVGSKSSTLFFLSPFPKGRFK